MAKPLRQSETVLPGAPHALLVDGETTLKPGVMVEWSNGKRFYATRARVVVSQESGRVTLYLDGARFGESVAIGFEPLADQPEEKHGCESAHRAHGS